MFNMYRRRYFARQSRLNGSEEELGHDRFNYMNPNVNYDKWPRRLRPKKNSLKVELEAPESPHMLEPDGRASSAFAEVHQRHCNGSLREHQRLLNLRSSRHKCSPRCRVKGSKSSTQNLSTEALVKVFACLGVQDSGTSTNDPAALSSSGYDIERDKLKGCQLKRPKRLSVFSASFSSIRYSSRTKDFSSSNGSTGVASVGDGDEATIGCLGGGSGSSSAAGGCGGGSGSGGGGCIELCEMERRMPRGVGDVRDVRELATNICRQYIRSSSRYHLLDHLKDIGSRIDKQWFMIRDATLKTERLLTIVPLTGSATYGCDVTTTDADETRNALVDLFTALQHPYIYPVLDVDFVYGAVATSNSPFCEEAKPVLVTVFPFNSKGSLKDLIYRSRWQDDWGQKYCQRSEGLPLLQVQRLGRQILEALLFLQERGFPPFGHLHSGNVIIQNGVARLTGFENTLLGFSSRIHPLVKSILPGTPAAVDTICFGHVLFEMCSGYELYAPKPTSRHLEDLQSYPQVVEVLDYIFNNPCEEYPTIGNLAILEFFRNIDLREMRCSTIYYNAKLTSAALSLLDQVQQKRRRKERPTSKTKQTDPQCSLSPPAKLETTCTASSSEVSSCCAHSREIDVHQHAVRGGEQPEETQQSYETVVEEEEEEEEVEKGKEKERLFSPTRSEPPPPQPPPPQQHRRQEQQDRLQTVVGDICRSAPESRRSELTLHFTNGAHSGMARTRSTFPTSCTSPSRSMIDSLMSLEAFRVNVKEKEPKGAYGANVSAQMSFYCSDDSFETPLESPCAEHMYYLNGGFGPVHAEAPGDLASTVAEAIATDPRPKLVLTPPDVNEAFAIEESFNANS